MENRFVPWDSYPKTLRHEEVIRPMMVLHNFFNADDVTGHTAHLKEWRDFALADGHYTDERFGPGNLLFTHQINIALLEAAFLLLLKDELTWAGDRADREQLSQERSGWDYFPADLSEEYCLMPFKAVRKVFDTFTLPQYRLHLNEWLVDALSNKTTSETLDPADVVGVYENLLLLYDACWLIWQRSVSSADRSVASLDAALSNGFKTSLTKAEQMGLKEVVKVMVKKLPSIRLIISLGVHTSPHSYYLLVIFSNEETYEEHQVANNLQQACKWLSSVFVIAHTVTGLKKAIDEDSRLFIKALEEGPVVYQSDKLALPVLPVVSEKTRLVRARLHWTRWSSQANDFLKGARYYKEVGNDNLIMFSLHQAIEGILMALNTAVLDYRVGGHNLARLIRMSLIFTNEVRDAFALDSETGIHRFEQLRLAYAKSRYKKDYQVAPETVSDLMAFVPLLLAVSQSVFEKFVERTDTFDQLG